VILGGGVIGVEFASVWRSFGAEVTIVEALEHLVPNEDIALSKGLERAFRRRGIAFSLGVLLYDQGWFNFQLGRAAATAWTMFLIIVVAVAVNAFLAARGWNWWHPRERRAARA